MENLAETESLIAFHHPQPAHALHILIVPRQARRSLMELSASDADFFTDLFQTVQALVLQFGLEERGYRLIANGGPYQDVPQVHFHLISDSGR